EGVTAGEGAGRGQRTGGRVWVDVPDWRDWRAAAVSDRAQGVARQSEGRRTNVGDSHTRLRGGESGGCGTHAAGNYAAPQRAGIRDQPHTARGCTAGAAE